MRSFHEDDDGGADQITTNQPESEKLDTDKGTRGTLGQEE
jgi:hypothetical protein